MSTQGYTTSFVVNQTPEEALSASIMSVVGGRERSKALPASSVMSSLIATRTYTTRNRG